MEQTMRELQERIGYTFRRQELFKISIDAQFLYERDTFAEI